MIIFLVLYKYGYCMISWFALTNDLRLSCSRRLARIRWTKISVGNKISYWYQEVEARNNGIFFLVIQIFLSIFGVFFQDYLQEQEVIGDWWKMMELGYFSIFIVSLKKYETSSILPSKKIIIKNFVTSGSRSAFKSILSTKSSIILHIILSL